MNLDVYDVNNVSHLGTLSEVYGVTFLDQLDRLGVARFQVDVASSADLALLQPRRVVRFRTGGSPGSGDVFACIVQDRPADLVSDIELESGETITVVTIRCLSLLAWLGYRQGGIALLPFRGFDGRQQNPRLFGPFAADFDDSAFASPTFAGPLSTEGWPDDQAVAFSFPNQAIFRRVTSASDSEGPARMFVVADWRTEVVVYRNGEEVIRKPAGKTGLFFDDQPYDGLGDAVVLHCVRDGGGTGRVGFTWVRLVESTDEDGNETFELGTTLRRTFDPADFPEATDLWVALNNYTVLPGVDVGYVMDVALTEADADGHTPMPTWTFTGGAGGADSDGQPWTREFARGFRCQKLGQLLDELRSIEGEAEMTPGGELKISVRRGQDRTGTVTISSPFALSLTGRGPQATRWVYETEGGLGQVINSAAESALGVRMTEFVQLGTDFSPDGNTVVVEGELEREGQVWDEIEVDLPDDVVPYSDVVLGDSVMCDGRDGSESVRLTSFEYTQMDNGEDRWRATAVPYTEPA